MSFFLYLKWGNGIHIKEQSTGCPVTDRGTLALQKNGQF